jgi:putative ABC transport system ATP-binding protein
MMNATTPAEVALSGMQLAKRVHGETLLHDIHITVMQSEVVVITGEPGAGKSTLINLLGGLDRPSAGTVHAHGRVVEHPNSVPWVRARRQDIGLLLQQKNLMPGWTVEEVLEATLSNRKLAPDAQRARMEELLEAFGAGHTMTSRVGTLSTVEQLRVAMARAFLNEPCVVLADEPFGGVGAEDAAALTALLIAVARARGTALVLTASHTVPTELADRVLELREGTIAVQDAVEAAVGS